MKLTESQIHDIFSNHGVLAENNPNFQSRQEQQSMAVTVTQAIKEQKNLLVEAGTGVGKTFAYLIPAILADKQVVISTGTKNLQDQLFKRDLPYVLKQLKISPLTALLKGRNNYLCEYRLQSTLASGRLPDPRSVKHLGFVQQWKDKTLSGDLSELSPLPEDSPLIPMITSTADNCLGSDCPFIDECFLANAREKAKKAKVLVVNHHLLLADLVLKEDGFGELLPDTDVFIIDEAHHLTKIAYQFYGDSLSSRQVLDLCKEVEIEYRTQVTDSRDLMLEAQRLAKEVSEFRLALPSFDMRADWKINNQLEKAVDNLSKKINKLFDIVKVNSSRTKVLESCFERLVGFKHTLSHFKRQTTDNKAMINWFETMKSGFRLHSTPLQVDQLFQNSRLRYENSSWILTSATLTVDNQFNHFIDALGWGNIKTLCLNSSFNYEEQSLLYVPRNLPHLKSATRIEQLIDDLLPIIQTAKGNSFLLFTSHKALKEAAVKMKELALFNCLVQGEESKEALLKKFTETDNAVLLATGSFWEGVDVQGDNLVLVVIDKLPFAPPDDPILNAKIKQARQNGENPFVSLQIPDAVLTLKQGSGRLIRSVKDRGVVCICDPRIVYKPYGEIFLNSLPNMKRTRSQKLVYEFLTDIIDKTQE